MQKEMNIESLEQAVVYDMHEPGRRQRSDSVLTTSDGGLFDASEIDPEIAQVMLEFEQSDSPSVSLRKKYVVE